MFILNRVKEFIDKEQKDNPPLVGVKNTQTR